MMISLSPNPLGEGRGEGIKPHNPPKPHNTSPNNPPTFTIISYYGFRKNNHSTNDS